MYEVSTVGLDRGGSVCLNRFRGLDKWISASVMLRPGLAAAGPDFTPIRHCDDRQGRACAAGRSYPSDQAGDRPNAVVRNVSHLWA